MPNLDHLQAFETISPCVGEQTFDVLNQFIVSFIYFQENRNCRKEKITRKPQISERVKRVMTKWLGVQRNLQISVAFNTLHRNFCPNYDTELAGNKTLCIKVKSKTLVFFHMFVLNEMHKVHDTLRRMFLTCRYLVSKFCHINLQGCGRYEASVRGLHPDSGNTRLFVR